MGENAQANRKHPVRGREGSIRHTPKIPAGFPGLRSPVQAHGVAAFAARRFAAHTRLAPAAVAGRVEHTRFCVPLRIASTDGG